MVKPLNPRVDRMFDSTDSERSEPEMVDNLSSRNPFRELSKGELARGTPPPPAALLFFESPILSISTPPDVARGLVNCPSKFSVSSAQGGVGEESCAHGNPLAVRRSLLFQTIDANCWLLSSVIPMMTYPHIASCLCSFESRQIVMTSLYTPSENECMPSSNTTHVNAAPHATRSDMAFCIVSSRHVPRMFCARARAASSPTSPGLLRQLKLRTHSWNMPIKSPSRKTTCTKFQMSSRKKVVPGKLVLM
mmetsp:Transcript_76893/g.220843  ORF Transcript_76893/g.220843 Transcript_76893/m.220843 type:complete len:249 (+) Transcript_76893:268-1014(+)